MGALFFFYACVEIPHFLHADGGEDGALESAFQCHQDIDSPVWAKRLPFFFTYFLVCSWCSVAISYRMFRSYGWGEKRYSGHESSCGTSILNATPVEELTWGTSPKAPGSELCTAGVPGHLGWLSHVQPSNPGCMSAYVCKVGMSAYSIAIRPNGSIC